MPAMTRMLTFALNDNAAANARQVLYIYKNVLGGELDISSVFVCMQKLSLGMHVSRPDVMGSNRRFTGRVCARLRSHLSRCVARQKRPAPFDSAPAARLEPQR